MLDTGYLILDKYELDILIQYQVGFWILIPHSAI